MPTLQRINNRWPDGRCIVAATGPSLTVDVANACAASGWPIIAVNDAYRLLPGADVLYACDAAWWDVHGGCPDFRGEKWSSHSAGRMEPQNDKAACQAQYGLSLVAGADGEGFSLDPARIHYGSNSGFQAVNLAILFGATTIVLVGFDLRGHTHFFGKHPLPLNQMAESRPGFERYIKYFEAAAKLLPPHIHILNCTPGSGLTCFPMRALDACLASGARHGTGEVRPGLRETELSHVGRAARG